MNPHLPHARRWQAAMIDLDGTMVDALPDFQVALGRMLDELQLPKVPASAVAAYIGKGGENLVRQVLTHVRQGRVPDASEAASALLRFRHHYDAVNGLRATVYPGVKEGLARLRDAGLPLACVTNKPVGATRALLARTGLEGFFQHVTGGDSYEKLKPHPMPLLRTCELLGTAPEATLMVGDSSNDAIAARAAGCPVILVNYGYNHGEPVGAQDCDGIVAAIGEIPLDGLRQAGSTVTRHCRPAAG